MSPTIWVAVGAGMGLLGWIIEQTLLAKKRDPKALKRRYL
jgi:hypothetical protein